MTHQLKVGDWVKIRPGFYFEGRIGRITQILSDVYANVFVPGMIRSCMYHIERVEHVQIFATGTRVKVTDKDHYFFGEEGEVVSTRLNFKGDIIVDVVFVDFNDEPCTIPTWQLTKIEESDNKKAQPMKKTNKKTTKSTVQPNKLETPNKLWLVLFEDDVNERTGLPIDNSCTQPYIYLAKTPEEAVKLHDEAVDGLDDAKVVVFQVSVGDSLTFKIVNEPQVVRVK